VKPQNRKELRPRLRWDKKDLRELRRLERLAKELDLQTSRKPYDPSPRAVHVSEEELLKLGGVKMGATVVFGRPHKGDDSGETQLTFTPGKDKWNKGQWKVRLAGKPSVEDLRRELAKAGRGLWNKTEDKPTLAFDAVNSLLECAKQFEGYPENEQQRCATQDAIKKTLESFKRGQWRKLRIAFELLTDNQPVRMIDKLQQQAWLLASMLQRPPSKGELKARFDPPASHRPHGKIHPSEWGKLLKHAGLGWLRRRRPNFG
jgi:hypothetical protein